MTAEAELAALWRRFLGAIETGDALTIGDCVAEDSRLFLPLPNTQAGLRGREAIVARFTRLFGAQRATPAAPRQAAITITNFECRVLGDGVVLAESMLDFGTEWGRRSIVFRRDAGQWRILHLHGSNVPAPRSQLPRSLG